MADQICGDRTNGAYASDMVQGAEGGAQEAGKGNEASAELLPAATFSANLGSITSLILLMERSLTEHREGAEKRRDAAEQSQERQEKQAVADMRKEADEILKGALVSGALSVGGGLIQVAGAGMNAHGVTLEANGSKAAGENICAQAKVVSAGGALVSASEKGASGIYQASAKERQADQAEHNNAAQAASREAKRTDGMADELGELRQKALARLEQLLDAQQQGRLALIQRA